MTRHFNYHPRWHLGNNSRVRSSAPVVSRWLWPGSRTGLEVDTMAFSWWMEALVRCQVMHTHQTEIPRRALLHITQQTHISPYSHYLDVTLFTFYINNVGKRMLFTKKIQKNRWYWIFLSLFLPLSLLTENVAGFGQSFHLFLTHFITRYKNFISVSQIDHRIQWNIHIYNKCKK